MADELIARSSTDWLDYKNLEWRVDGIPEGTKKQIGKGGFGY